MYEMENSFDEGLGSTIDPKFHLDPASSVPKCREWAEYAKELQGIYTMERCCIR